MIFLAFCSFSFESAWWRAYPQQLVGLDSHHLDSQHLSAIMEDFWHIIPAGRHWRFVATFITVLTWAVYFVHDGLPDIQQLHLDLDIRLGM